MVMSSGGHPGSQTTNIEDKMKHWIITLPSGAEMSGRMDEGKADQVNILNAAGNYSGSIPLTVWLDGLDKIKAAGGVIIVEEA